MKYKCSVYGPFGPMMTADEKVFEFDTIKGLDDYLKGIKRGDGTITLMKTWRE